MYVICSLYSYLWQGVFCCSEEPKEYSLCRSHLHVIKVNCYNNVTKVCMFLPTS